MSPRTAALAAIGLGGLAVVAATVAGMNGAVLDAVVHPPPLIRAALVGASAALATKPGSGSANGQARVFVPNPVQDLGNQDLTDQKDADDAALQGAYRTVRLTNLDGSGFLRGDWAEIVGETGNPAYSPTNTFLFNRSQDEFEQVMAYYWITEAQRYIQSLGFRTGGPLPPVN